MNQSSDFDVVILGGGMTGLTLAHHIAQQNVAQPARTLNTLILEPRILPAGQNLVLLAAGQYAI